MNRLKKRLAFLTISILVALVGCQNVRSAHQISSTVDRAKVASTLDKFQSATEDSAESYMNLSLEEMEVFIDLSYQRQLRQLERNPVGYCTVFFGVQGRKVDGYNPKGEVENRKMRLSEEGLAEERAELTRGDRKVVLG